MEPRNPEPRNPETSEPFPLSLLPKHSVFLDRDGVINEDSPDYIKGWDEFRFIPGSRSAIAALTRSGVRVFVVSNQSGVNRGLIPLPVLEQMHRRMTAAVEEAGGRIEAIFYCPHRPDEDCSCRKPRPAMLDNARRIHGVDLSRSAMIGDSARDILAARRAGCALSVLVKTGKGVAAEKELADSGVRPDHVAENLDSAVHWILSQWF